MDRTAETSIDLGLMDPGLDRSEPAAVPVRWPRWALAVLVVLPGMSLAGAAGPAAPTLRELWTVSDSGHVESAPGPDYTADERRLYLATAGRLVAYRLADGRIEWQAGLPASADDYLSVRLIAGLPVVTISGANTRTIAYQASSGRERWRHPGAPAWEAGEPLTLTDTTLGPAGRDEVTVTVVDPVTGRATGGARLDEPQWAMWEAPDGGPQLLALARDGRLSRYDLATGELVKATQTPYQEVLVGNPTTSLDVVAGGLVVSSPYTDPPAVAGYDPVTLAHRWTAPRSRWPYRCGRSVCVEWQADDETSAGVRMLDPTTGRIRWSVDCAADDAASGGCSVRIQQLADRKWVEQVRWWDVPEDLNRFSSWVADPGTGEPLAGPTSWRLRGQVGEGELLLSRREARPETGPSGEPVPLWWARSDIDPFRPAVLGAVRAEFCDPRHPYLICWTWGEGLAIWQVGS